MKTLFEPPLARDTDVITSHIAAEKMVKSGELNRQEMLIYRAIKQLDRENVLRKYISTTFTARELNDEFSSWDGIDYYTIQRRLSGLRNKGKIERLNTEGGVYIEGQKLMKRDGCAVWRLRG